MTTEYLNRLRQHAFLQGLDVSGTAVMNDFCLPPGPEARQGVSHVRTWIDRAAATRRTDASASSPATGSRERPRTSCRVGHRADRVALPYAADKGVMLALENHGGGVTVTADQLLRLVRAVKAPNFGVNLDTGNFHGADPYAEIAQARPIRCQRPGQDGDPSAKGVQGGRPTCPGDRHPPRVEVLGLRRARVQRPRGPQDGGPPVHQDASVSHQLMIAPIRAVHIPARSGRRS